MEVLGAVSSAVALAEIFAKSVLTTKKLWDEAQDVPEEINRLMNDLTHLKPILEEAEAVFNNQAQNPSTDTALLLMHNYKEASGKLHVLAADLNQRVVTAKRGKRNLTKLKATLSKTLIQRYQRELDGISQTLSFFFNVHNLYSQKESQALHLESISLHRSTDDKICQLLSLVQPRLLPQTGHNVQAFLLEGDPNSSDGEMVEDGAELSNQSCLFQRERRQKTQKAKPIAWRRPRLFGNYTYQTSEHPGNQGTKVLQVRLELPWCLSGRAWDFEAYSSPMGWNISIRPWTTRPCGDRIFELVRKGSWPEIAEQLNSCQASILDRSEVGLSLLDIALRNDRFDVARRLVNMGFEIEGSGLLEDIGSTWIHREASDFGHVDALAWFQCATELGLLEILSEKVFWPAADHRFTFVVYMISPYLWTIPGLFSLFLKESTAIHGGISIFEMFGTLWWRYTDPCFILELCRNKSIDPQLFRQSIMKSSRLASLAEFARAYFSFAPDCVFPGHVEHWVLWYKEPDFKYWRELTTWILTDASVDELVWQYSEGSNPFDSDPFLSGLCHGVPDLEETGSSPRNVRLNKCRLTQTMFSWLEDVQASGVDLAEYGRRQLELYHSYGIYERWWKLSTIRLEDNLYSYGPRLMSFTFGPRPQNWKLIWDPDFEEFAGEFWEVIENPPLHIPGAYPEDD